jgi:hypothetical protein
MRETHFDGSRSGKNFSLDRQTEPRVMDSEISGLEDKHAFLKLGNHVARFSFLYSDLPRTQKAFVPRPLEDDELAFDPKTLKAKRADVGKATEEAGGGALEDEVVLQSDEHDDTPEDEDERVQPGYGHFDRSGF